MCCLQALKNGGKADQYLQEAKQAAAALNKQKDQLDAPSKKRLDLLNTFLKT